MKRASVWFIVGMVVMVLAGGSTQAVTTMWLSTDAAGTRVPGDTLNVAPGATIQLYCFLESDDVGNTFEVMVGYDASDATTYGPGKGTAQFGKLVLLSTKSAIESSMPASFAVLRTAAAPAAVLDASSREASNSWIGGRPYGFVGREATLTNAVPGKVLCFSFQLRNNMTTPGDSQYVVLSNESGGNSYSDAWKYGTSLSEAAYALKVVNASARPTVGANNRAVLDAIMTAAAPNYIWVLWGEVTVIDSGSFTIDDGSGVNIKVVAPGHGLTSGKHVGVRGTLDVSTTPPTLTSQEITTYN